MKNFINNMRKTSFYCVIILALLLACFLVSCGNNGTANSTENIKPTDSNPSQDTPKPNPNTEIIESKDAHYLVFKESGESYDDATTLVSLIVFEGDTYEDLEPYFPLVPNKIIGGYEYTGKWNIKAGDKVYDSDKKEIIVTATYTAVD